MEFLRMMLVLFYTYLSLLSLSFAQQQNNNETEKTNGSNSPSVTQTVYGFLDFTTTISNTVMVFTPQSVSTTSEKTTPSSTTSSIINERPQSENNVTKIIEIQPSKPASESQASSDSNRKDTVTTTSKSVDHQTSLESKNNTKDVTKPSQNDEKKQKDKKQTATPKIVTKTSSPDTLDAKSSTKKIDKNITKTSPKPSPSQNITQQNTKILKTDKPKPTKPANTKSSDTITESSVSQLVSTKKFNKENNSKSKTTATSNISKETATKSSVVQTKSQKIESFSKPQIITPVNGTATKTSAEITDKTTPILTTKVNFINDKNTSKEDNNINTSVVIASKVEIREGPISIVKKKKPDIDPTITQLNSSPASVVNEVKLNETEKSTPENIFAITVERENFTTTDGNEEPAVISSSGVVTPEYDFLSRQPSEIVDETYKVIDLKSNNGNGKHQKNKNNGYRTGITPADYEETQPLGLITSLSDSIIKDGLTTVYETKVIGTVISGRYAQVLQSNSHILSQKKIKPTASSSARILKTAAPLSHRDNRIPVLEPTPVIYDDESSSLYEISYNNNADHKSIKTSRKPSLSNNAYSKNKYSANKNKFREDYRDDYGTTSQDEDETFDTVYTFPNSNPTSPTSEVTPSFKKTSTKNKSSQRPSKFQNNRFNRPTTPELATVSVFSESQSSVTPSYSSSGRRFSPSNSRRTTKQASSTESEKSYSNAKRSYKSKIGPSNVENNQINSPASSSIYKFKLSRPTGRWQYKTSPKPRVTIRRQDDSYDNVTTNPIPQFSPDIHLEPDQELSGSVLYSTISHEDNSIAHEITPSLTVETLRIDISTPVDFKDIYYEIATIKSPYTFQVGTVKNTRFITVTSTIEKNLLQATESPTSARNEPLSENILARTHNAYDKEPPLDSSIATLPPIGLAGDAETPPLETMTESFSTTQLMLKTHILPVVRGGSDTTKYTLVQSYHVTRLVTATKTLPPMEVYQFVPSKTLNEFNTRLDEAGSEVHLELEFGDNNEQDEESRPNVAKALLSDLDLTNIGSDFDISDVDKNKLLEQHLRTKKLHKLSSTTSSPPPPVTSEAPTTPALSAEQLQQLALLRLLNPNAAMPNMITSSKPIIKVETAYETHVLPVFNGISTYYSTISKPTATVTKTEYEYVTNTMPALVQPSAFNPLFPPQPSLQVATTPLVTQTMVTETDSKVLKLTFGAKTTFTTLYSTRVTPTILTTYLTNSIVVQPTAATFPSFFNAPYGFNAPFPFVG